MQLRHLALKKCSTNKIQHWGAALQIWDGSSLNSSLGSDPLPSPPAMCWTCERQHDCCGPKVRVDQALELWTETKRLLLPVRRLIALLLVKQQQQQIGWRSVDVVWDQRWGSAQRRRKLRKSAGRTVSLLLVWETERGRCYFLGLKKSAFIFYQQFKNWNNCSFQISWFLPIYLLLLHHKWFLPKEKLTGNHCEAWKELCEIWIHS